MYKLKCTTNLRPKPNQNMITKSNINNISNGVYINLVSPDIKLLSHVVQKVMLDNFHSIKSFHVHKKRNQNYLFNPLTWPKRAQSKL